MRLNFPWQETFVSKFYIIIIIVVADLKTEKFSCDLYEQTTVRACDTSNQ